MDENDYLTKLPNDLPQPHDDGSCDHLLGVTMPNNIMLPSANGGLVDVCGSSNNNSTCFTVLYFFPKMAASKNDLPYEWNSIPGARGCTPQNMTISNHKDELLKYSSTPIGISAQSVQELSELSKLRKLSQTILSDEDLVLKEKLGLPTFQIGNETMYKRLTLILRESKIIKVFYPVFPPDKHIFEVLRWLKENFTDNSEEKNCQ